VESFFYWVWFKFGLGMQFKAISDVLGMPTWQQVSSNEQQAD
jgi:hypothetical protein